MRAQVRSPTRAHQAHACRLATSALGRKDRLNGSWANKNDARAPSECTKNLPRSARGQILRGRRFVDGRERREERAAAVAVGDVERAGEALEARRVGPRRPTAFRQRGSHASSASESAKPPTGPRRDRAHMSRISMICWRANLL